MRVFFAEILHKLVVAVAGVAAGMYGLWYSQQHHWSMWTVAAIAVGATVVLDLIFHPILWAIRHRPRRPVYRDEVAAAE